MTEEGKNDFRIVCRWLFFLFLLSFMVSVACPYFNLFYFLLCMTSVTLCDLLFVSVWVLHFLSCFCHCVSLELETCNTMGNYVIPSKQSNHPDYKTHTEKWCRQWKHKSTPTHSQERTETHPPSAPLRCPAFQREIKFWWIYGLCKSNEAPKVA